MTEYHGLIDWIMFFIALCAVAWIAGTSSGKARGIFMALDVLILSMYACNM